MRRKTTRDELGHVIPCPRIQQSRRRRQAHQVVELHRIRAVFSPPPPAREEGGVSSRPRQTSSLVSHRIPHHITLQGTSQRRRGLSQVTKDLPRPSVNTCFLHHQDEDEQRKSRCTASEALSCPTQTGRNEAEWTFAIRRWLTWMVFCPTACDRSKNTLLKERIWISRVTSELVSAFHPDTDVPFRDECVVAVRQELNLHLCLQLDITDGMRPPLNVLTY